MTGPAALFVRHAGGGSDKREAHLFDHFAQVDPAIEQDFNSLTGTVAINYRSKRAIFNNKTSAHTFQAQHPDWTVKVV